MVASSIANTLRHAAAVQGFYSAPASSLVMRKTAARNSDMFCLSVSHKELALKHQNEGGESVSPLTRISLADYHLAFLTSPLFTMELTLLQRFGMARRESITQEHLEDVTHGRQSSFALWTLLHQETIPDKSSTLIMRAVIPNRGPFCDTWWSIEHHNDHDTLVFGTSLVVGIENAQTNRIAGPLLRITDPLHRLYSRLLLASAKENLLMRLRQQ